MSEPKHSAPDHSEGPPQQAELSEEPMLPEEPMPTDEPKLADEPKLTDEPKTEPGPPSGGPRQPRGLSRWLAPIALIIALISAGVAVWALLRPHPASTAAAHFTDQQTADAKGRACTAAKTALSAVALQTHADLGTEPVAVQAVAANARLAMVGGGTYLLAHLDPATPPQLASSIRSFANDLQDIAMNALAGVGNDDPTQAGRLRDGENLSGQIVDMCK